MGLRVMGFGEHLTELPDSHERRYDSSLDAPHADQTTRPTQAERHIGPVGDRAVPLLEAFGLEAGATWSELRERFLEMRDATSQRDETDAIVAAELSAFRRDINASYASLRLLAAA
ncbi:MAG: hypothetical protein R2706_16835 [Acidimicrobiales bacterium]